MKSLLLILLLLLPGNPVRLRSGMLLRPVQGDGEVSVETSMDKGAHWMPFGGKVEIQEKVRDGHNYPQLLPLRDGRILLLYSAHGYNWRYGSISTDFGQSWSAPEPFFLCPWTPSAICVLPSGKWLLVKNGKIDQNLFYLPDGLYAYLSDDEGATWYGGMLVDKRVDAVNPEIEIPGNGVIIITYEYAPQDGSSSEKRRVITGEAEIGSSTLSNAKAPLKFEMLQEGETPASAEYAKWLGEVTSPNKRWAEEPLRVATYNIEYKHPDPKRPSWEERLPYVNWVVREYGFDVFGVQEPFEPEYHQLEALLGDEYDSVFASTNLTEPDFSNSIFWKRSRVEKLDDGVFWYTENPGQKGGFGGASSRLCIWAKFRDKKTGKVFFLFNSHYDLISAEAMLLSSRLLVNKVREIAGDCPSVLTGDFNCSELHPAIKWIDSRDFLTDAMNYAQKTENAEYSSMRRYAPTAEKTGRHLDHIFVTEGSTSVLRWKMIMDDYEGMRGGSDHMPIYIDWIISN